MRDNRRQGLTNGARRGISRRVTRPAMRTAAAALVTLAWAGSAAAQVSDAASIATGDGETSFFQQFFWTSDPLGLCIIWLLLLMSFASIGFAIRLFISSRRSALLPEETVGRLRELLSDKQYRAAIEYVAQDVSYVGKLVGAALGEAGAGYNAMERAIDEEGDYEMSRMLRPVEYLNIVGNISPMLGLFGTVYGMIVAFQALVSSGGKPDPATLAAGISTALVTTFWGLIVAMPALASYALVRNRIDALTAEGVTVASDLVKAFKPAPRRAATSAPASGGASGSGEGA